MRWAEYVRQLVAGENQVAIAAKTGIAQSTISRWLQGKITPQPGEAAKLATVYGGNVLEAFVAAGFLTEEQAGMPPRPRLTFSEVIDRDQHLSPEAKVHIKNQYGLLRAASAQNRAVLVREQIERSQTLDPETRAQLLATLDGGSDDLVEQVTEAMGHEEARQFPQIVREAARQATGQEKPADPDPNRDPEGPPHGA